MTPVQTTSPFPRECFPTCSIIPAEVGDLESICRFDFLSLRNYPQRDFVACAIEEGRCWVAFVNDTPAGYGIFNYQFQGYGAIQRIFVSPDYRRRGIGRAILDHFAAACSSPRIYITVPQRELPMLELLRVRGFVLSGVVHDFGPDGAGLIYSKNLLTSSPPLARPGLQ